VFPGGERQPACGRARFPLDEPFRPAGESASPGVFGVGRLTFVPDEPVRPEVGDADLQAIGPPFDRARDVHPPGIAPDDAEVVPVEPDGSAYFRAPAGKPIYFQGVDESGRAVQSMRSATYLQPGERRGCVGCHEPPGSAAANRPTLAMRRAPSRLQPGPEGARPFSFPLLVQPVLDRHCVRCHDGQEGPGKSKLALDGEPANKFTRSYQGLKPFLRWYEWGGASISQIATHPGQIGADASPLTAILDDANHRPELKWSDAERRRIYLWLDANVPFYGTYSHEEQVVQLQGQPIAPPRAQ